MLSYENELIPHGVKGMRWGVRKDNYNSNYSPEQRLRDKTVYGSGGVKRINKSMNKGHSISSARSKEAARINSARNRARVAGQAGKTIGQIGGAIGGYYGSKFVTKALKTKISALNDPTVEFAVQAAIAGGASSVATQLGRYGSRAAVMTASGYSPKKYR